MINLHDQADIAARRPIMIAHRGGVIAPDAPENSQRAIELAAQQGYDLVELDICCAADQAPVLFHGHGGRGGMVVDCGVAGTIRDFSSTELTKFPYLGTNQRILTLEQALDLCVHYDLGVMLDMKTFDANPLPGAYLQRVVDLFTARNMQHAIMTLSTRPEVQAALPATTLWPIRAHNLHERLDSGESLAGYFWFDDPDSVTDKEIDQLRERDALTIACINSFRYPAHSFQRLEAVDIARMKACNVDGWQIDSQYGRFFEKLIP
jgi:glycerophosphoryl diester phosphodiesterase